MQFRAARQVLACLAAAPQICQVLPICITGSACLVAAAGHTCPPLWMECHRWRGPRVADRGAQGPAAMSGALRKIAPLSPPPRAMDAWDRIRSRHQASPRYWTAAINMSQRIT